MLARLAGAVYARWFARDTCVARFFQHRVVWIRRLAFWGTLGLYPLFCAVSWLRILCLKALGRKPAVLWAPTPILNISDSSELLRRLGYSSDTLVFTVYHISSRFDYNLKPALENPAVNYWMPNVLFLWALLRYDVFHFFYDGGLWSGMKIVPAARWIELPLLRLAGKRVIASAYGADVRTRVDNEKWQPYNACQQCPDPGKHCICDQAAAAENTSHYRDWCNEILAMGDMHDYVFASRKSFNHWPVDTDAVANVGPPGRNGVVRFVHSPNHRFFKGTKFIEAAIGNLQKKGLAVELDIVERVSNVEAKRRYAEGDVIVAQCLYGWMGFTEFEGMAAGKPVVTYLRTPEYLDHAPGCPAVSAHPGALEAELERLARDKQLRIDLGERGRRYVEQHWSYHALAPKYAELHERVWRCNELGKTLATKWRDFRHGELRWRATPVDQARDRDGALGVWPVAWAADVALDRIAWGHFGQPPYDEHGLPRIAFQGAYIEHPGVVAWWGMSSFLAARQNSADPQRRENFMAAARWLRNRLHIDERGVGRWRFPHEVRGRLSRPTVPWAETFSPAFGLAVLLRAAEQTNDPGFRTAADAVANAWRTPWTAGGVLDQRERATGDKDVWFVESIDAPQRGRFDAHAGAVLALAEYARVAGPPWAAPLIDASTLTLARSLPQFFDQDGAMRGALDANDRLDWDDARYALAQLESLHRLTGRSEFDRHARRLRRSLYRHKLLRFCRFQAPL